MTLDTDKEYIQFSTSSTESSNFQNCKMEISTGIQFSQLKEPAAINQFKDAQTQTYFTNNNEAAHSEKMEITASFSRKILNFLRSYWMILVTYSTPLILLPLPIIFHSNV